MKFKINGCPVDTYQDEKEFERLLSVVKSLQPKVVLEIGSLIGGTLWHWMKFCPPESIIISIDRLVDETDDRFHAQVDGHNTVWHEWAREFNQRLYIITGDSTSEKIIQEAKMIIGQNGLLDFLFIDGGHDQETVRSDFVNYSQMVKDGGVVAFHDIDYNEGSVFYGVKPLWETLKRLNPNTEEVITVPGERGIGIYHA